MKHVSSSFLALLCLFGASVFAQPELAGPDLRGEILAGLTAQGFQNLSVHQDQDRLTVGFENRVYRFEPKAVKKVMAFLQTLDVSRYRVLELQLKYRGIPLVNFRYHTENLNWFTGRHGTRQYLGKPQVNLAREPWRPSERTINTGQFKAEVVLIPQLRLGLGGHPDPFVHQVNLLPTANLYLWPGSRLRFQAILPVSNEFQVPEDKMIRPGLMTFNQVVKLPAQSYASFTAGYFTNYNYGISLQVGKFFGRGNLFLQARLGYTGYASFPRRIGYDQPQRGWQFSDIDYLDYSGSLSYRHPGLDLILKLEFGRFLLSKEMLRFSATRQFGEIDLGFFALLVDDGENYGFRLSVPLFPSRYFKPRRLQLRPARYFQYTYHGTQNYVPYYETGERLADIFRHRHPGFLEGQLRQ